MRYWLFHGDFYYANGGANDLKSKHDTYNEAAAAAANLGCSTRYWAHILDTETGDIMPVPGFLNYEGH